MVAIRDITQISEQIGINSYKVHTTTSQAIATNQNINEVINLYKQALTDLCCLNYALETLFITANEPKQQQLIGPLYTAINFANINIGLAEQYTLQPQLAHITTEIKEQLEFTAEILNDLVLVHLKMPKMKPFKYSKEFRATFV